jgi:hypothetical protein
MDIDTYAKEFEKRKLQEQETRELLMMQKEEIAASLRNITFTRKVSIATLIISILSLLVAIFK